MGLDQKQRDELRALVNKWNSDPYLYGEYGNGYEAGRVSAAEDLEEWMVEQPFAEAEEKSEKILLEVTSGEYYILTEALAYREGSYDIFKDDSDEGYWRPKHKLGALTEKIVSQFKKQRK